MKNNLTINKVLTGALCLSIALLAFAYGTQYFLGIKSCALCQYQRYLHMLVVAICATALWIGHPSLSLKAIFTVGAAYLGTSGVAFYQVLVEKKIVELPHICKAPALDYSNFSQFRQAFMGHTHVPCDEVTWSLFGISMAGYSALIALLAGLACLLSGIMIVGGKRVGHES
jgi:disulfide bond formation protein DsbB